ncbi:MAG: glycerophosphodiester phosphodiesterase [Sporichthyaceae bacterium]
MLAAAVLATPALVAGASAQASPDVAAAPQTATPDRSVTAAPTTPEKTAKRKVPAQFRNLQVIGHRGARDLGPENTLQGIEAAFRAGAKAVEFDVNFTRDGKIVLLHDFLLDRTTNCTGDVTKTDYAKVAKCRTDNGEPVPSLKAALAEVERHNGKAYVHIKQVEDAKQARLLIGAISRSELGTRVTVIASRLPILARLQANGASRLGYVFDDAKGWKTDFPVLVPFNVKITKEQVARAQRRGQFVIAVESKPLGIHQLGRLGLDGFMANDLERSMWELQGAPPQIRDERVRTEEPAASGWTETPEINDDGTEPE